MKIFKIVLAELGITKEQLQDKEIQKFIYDYIARKYTGQWIQWKNGNAIIEINKNNGTSIRTILDDEDYNPEFPENIDMNISTYCENNCSFCYEGCNKRGKHADIKKFINDKNSFLYTLHEGSELALNGNEPLHPDLELLLKFCKERNILANLTVQENTLIKHKEQIEKLLDDKLIHGIGISPCQYSDDLINFCKNYPTAVIHTIAGITTMEQYQKLMDQDLKILILGYKDFGRGITYASKHNETIDTLIKDLSTNLKDFPNHFKVVSFDNLAIEQLDVKSILTQEQWETFYRGSDGNHTLYVDLVRETFAKNSIQPKENRKALLNDIRDMLKVIHDDNI